MSSGGWQDLLGGGGIITNESVPVYPGQWARGGRLVNLEQDERAGLGDVATRWPDLRIFANPGPAVKVTPGGTTATVPFKVRWGRQWQLVSELVGWPFVAPGGIFKRHAPESFRNWEFLFSEADTFPTPVIYCTHCDVQGIGDGAQHPDYRGAANYYPFPTYEWLVVHAHFETLTYDIALRSALTDTDQAPLEMQRNVYKHEEAGGRYQTFNWGEWVLEAGGAVREANTRAVNFWEPFKTITYEWFDVLPEAVNWDRAEKLQGFTNNAEFDGKAAETLILQKARRTPTKTQLGIRTFKITYEFLYVPTGVNKARPPGPTAGGEPEYWNVVRRDTALAAQPQKPYTGKLMADLFRP